MIGTAQNHIFTWQVVIAISVFTGFCGTGYISAAGIPAGENFLTLESAVLSAQQNDPWLVGNKHQQESLEARSVSESTLPDPKMSAALANLPTDTFDFSQEPMTQFKVGITQMFPRGDSLKLKGRQLKAMSAQFPYQRLNRKAKVTTMVSELWLSAYKAQESITLIEQDRPLFEQLADVVEASYSSALGKTRQQDLVRAQLEITSLDDRLTILRQKHEMRIGQLSEWLSKNFLEYYSETPAHPEKVPMLGLVLKPVIPDVVLLNPELSEASEESDPQLLYTHFSRHPAVLAVEERINASKLGVALANEKYKPEWGINASYGFRDEDRQGRDLADFFSVGISFDLPFFTKNRQNKEVESAVSLSEAVKTEKWLLLRQMISGFEKSRTDLIRLKQRQHLYRNKLLPQLREQAEASLTAYTNDDGDFAEVVRARIAELNGQITALGVDVDIQKTIIKLNYYFTTKADNMISVSSSAGDMK